MSALPLVDSAPAAAGDAALVERLRAGDQRAFAEVVDAWSPAMIRLARGFVSSHASAEDVVQDAWVSVVRNLAAFEGRSSLRTWVFRIVVNTAKTRAVKEHRVVPWSSLGPDDAGPTVDPSRFAGADVAIPFGWTDEGAPRSFEPTPEGSLMAGEVRALLAAALQDLPDRQRTVVALRDVHGLSSDEVCQVLDISPANQRVLLHRGRAGLRAALEDYYRGRPDGGSR